MKKVIWVLVILSMAVATPLFALQDVQGDAPADVSEESFMPPAPGMMEESPVPPMGRMMGQGPGFGSEKMGKMCGMMMGKANMEVANDGSVIVLVGNKLMKYDADLNLVKEVEVKTPAMDWKKCPRMKAMSEKGAVESPAM